MNRRAGLMGVVLAGWLGFLAGNAAAIDHTTDTLETVKKNLAAKGALLLDVREKDEWDAGHLQAARLTPLSGLKETAQLEQLLKDLPKDKVIDAHCRSGKRCLNAGEILKSKGYDVRPLKAGYEDLLKAGFEKAK
ncbi:MAG: rhodanese-like domain-containing protein [Planctomycetaceae bacterium]